MGCAIERAGRRHALRVLTVWLLPDRCSNRAWLWSVLFACDAARDVTRMKIDGFPELALWPDLAWWDASSFNPAATMIHYTCDRCHRAIDTDAEVRYAVEVQIQPVDDAAITPTLDPDADHLLELNEMLERLDESAESGELGARVVPTELHQQFDLCSDCYKLYAQNPLSREFSATARFSEN